MTTDLQNTYLSPRDWTSHSPHIYPGYKSTLLRGPKQPLVPIKQALSQLTAPVYGTDQPGPLDHDLTKTPSKTASRWASASSSPAA